MNKIICRGLGRLRSTTEGLDAQKRKAGKRLYRLKKKKEELDNTLTLVDD